MWGFKKSFRQYVSAGRGNRITASDGAEITTADAVANSAVPSGAYRFTLKSGQYTSATEFTAQFAGKVTFAYPAHFFTLSLANPKIQVAQGKGTLYADAELATTAGAPSLPVSRPGAALATLDLSAAHRETGTGLLTVSGIGAVLNRTDVFAEFYQGGEVLDEPSVTLAADCARLPAAGGNGPAGTGTGPGGAADLVPDVAFRPGELANTGTALGPLWWGAALLLAGGALVLSARRGRRAS
ncbi:HtaA domain-containing protein [Amycolatopsis sp. PS_44_ISF1]|nr:HtaA domain-containing protein [Amycolatopsis sp. PS_44_ISF1]